MARTPQRKSEESVPESFAETPPPAGGAGLSMWLLNALTETKQSMGKLEATLEGYQGQMNRIESKLDTIEKDVRGHGHWMHTLKAFSVVVAAIMTWIIGALVVPWLKAKLFGGQ